MATKTNKRIKREQMRQELNEAGFITVNHHKSGLETDKLLQYALNKLARVLNTQVINEYKCLVTTAGRLNLCTRGAADSQNTWD